MKIKQLEWIKNRKFYYSDFIWQYYDENNKPYGDLLAGYLITSHEPLNNYYVYFGDDENYVGECLTLKDAKQIAQHHFESFIKGCIEND